MKKDTLTEILAINRKTKSYRKRTWMFIRIYLDAESYIFIKIVKIYNHIIESTKKWLIDMISKKLLELEFKSNYSIKSETEYLEYVVDKILPLV